MALFGGGLLYNQFGNLGNELFSNPDWTPAPLDANTAGIINEQYARGNLSDQDLVNLQLQGTNPTMAPATGGAVGQQQATLGGVDAPAVTQALNDRANRLYAGQYNQLKNQAIANAPNIHGNLLSQGANALLQQQAINNELNRQQVAVTLQKEAMRNQIVANLMGGAGSFTGGYMGRNAMKNSGNGPSPQYSGDENSPNFMGPPRPTPMNGGQAWSGPDYEMNGRSSNLPSDSQQWGLGPSTINGYGTGMTYEGLG